MNRQKSNDRCTEPVKYNSKRIFLKNILHYTEVYFEWSNKSYNTYTY